MAQFSPFNATEFRGMVSGQQQSTSPSCLQWTQRICVFTLIISFYIALTALSYVMFISKVDEDLIAMLDNYKLAYNYLT